MISTGLIQARVEVSSTGFRAEGMSYVNEMVYNRRRRRRYKKADRVLIQTLPSQVRGWVQTCRRLQNNLTSVKLAAVDEAFYSLNGDDAVLARRIKNARDFLFDSGHNEVFLHLMVLEAGLSW